MGEIVEFAEALATELGAALTDAGNRAKATANINHLNPPCVLVSPVPRREYDDLAGGFEAVWQVFLIAPGAGDLTDAKTLEALCDVVAPLLPGLTTVEPASYALLSGGDPKPAYLLTFSNHVTP